MRAVNLMFDSLNRHMLSAYGCEWTHTPNFDRLARRTVTFNRAYCGSMPCMPARREMHTARPNLLHTPWAPMEPFDDSAIEMLNQQGVQTHLVSDHYHYWEAGAGNYHTKFKTWEFYRGQEGDPFLGYGGDPTVPDHENKKGRPQDWINRMFIRREPDWPITRTIHAGIDYLKRNAKFDHWFLQLECFDPHEPWYVPERYKDLYPALRDFDGPLFDWPGYCPVDPADDPPEKIERARKHYAALLSMCDAYLGDVLDVFDELDLWDDTMLIVNTDHGFLLGEHDWWAKNAPPWYEELSHLPLFIWDPRQPETAGQRRDSFVQTIDLPVTLLGYFGIEPTEDMLGTDLASVLADDTGGRGAGLFGGWGHYVNVTDGRYVYMRAPVRPDNQPLSRYTLIPMSLRGGAQSGNPPTLEPAGPFSFTKGLPVWRIAAPHLRNDEVCRWGHLLWDVQADPKQQQPIRDDPALEQRMRDLLVEQMRLCDAPAEQFERLGLSPPMP